MSEVQTALLGALRDLQHPGDDRMAVVRQTDAELHGPGVYHHGDASRVVVLTVEGEAAVPGPTGEQLCRYLELSEVPAKLLTVGLDGRLTGEVIVAHANALGCDLLIKGAYTQSRSRKMIFGGTARYILSNAQLPSNG
jgi:nucleotide-binding universal stress UspA family protein